MTEKIVFDVDKEITSVVKRLLDEIRAGIVKTSLSAMGFTNNWGIWEVDNCNDRQSAASKFVTEEAKAMLASLDWKHEEILTPKAKKAIKSAIIRDVKQEMLDQLRRDVNKAIKHYIEDTINEVLEETKTKDNIKAMINDRLDFTSSALKLSTVKVKPDGGGLKDDDIEDEMEAADDWIELLGY